MSDIIDFADLVVVGSGPAGAAFARAFADERPGARIIMLEAGPIVSDPPGHHVSNLRDPVLRAAAERASQGPNRDTVYAPMTEEEWQQRIAGRPEASMLRRPGLFAVGQGEVDGDGFPAAHAASNVGGMGAHWFGGCPRPAAAERVPFISAGEMEAALDRAEQLLHSAADQYPGSPVATALEARLGRVFNEGRPVDRIVQPMPMALVRTPSGQLKSGTDVILGDLLSTGPDRFDLRPETVCRRIIVERGHATGVEVWNTSTGSSQIEAGAVVVAADALHSPQLLFASGIRPPALGHYLNEHLQVGMLAELEGVVVDGAETGVTWVPFVDESFPYSVTITRAAPSMFPFGPAERDGKPILFISVFICADLCFDNRVEFEPSRLDWRGLPALRTFVRPTAADRDRIEAAKEVAMRIGAAAGRPLPGFSPMSPPLGSSLHYQGTVRMGAEDNGTSVCDRDSRIWGLANVFVAGNGVIPTVTATNPTLTSVALATLAAKAAADLSTRQPGSGRPALVRR